MCGVVLVGCSLCSGGKIWWGAVDGGVNVVWWVVGGV